MLKIQHKAYMHLVLQLLRRLGKQSPYTTKKVLHLIQPPKLSPVQQMGNQLKTLKITHLIRILTIIISFPFQADNTDWLQNSWPKCAVIVQ